MKKRILTTATLSVTALFAGTSLSFAQASPAADALKPATDAAKAAANPAPATSSLAAPATSAMTSTATTAAQPSADEMKKMMAEMMELAKMGENHKLLAEMAGSWTYTVKMWMDPSGKPQESKGTATRKAIMDGRFMIAEHSGKFQMPGADGKMKNMDFKGMAIEGYDNVKKKFVSSWIDNMGTMILNSEGTYDAASKTFNYTANCEMMPGMPVKIREVVKITDKDHHMFEWYEDRGQGETKTMEIAYTRSGKK
ncbi:MAG: hypothetical protein DMF06_04490 [Verrucomicrobia bacterium]|nr:MAG: hypothetical protein DMF06_04490 [Verrucomicrobiota bacterium]